MKEHGVILRDLRQYLRENGLTADVIFEGASGSQYRQWVLSIMGSKCYRSFYIADLIHIDFPSLYQLPKSIVSLADPRYKEKFYEYAKVHLFIFQD